MERRHFLKSLFAVAGALGVAAVLPKAAEAMPLTDPAKGAPAPAAIEPAVATPDDIENARVENVQYYYRRRRYFFRPRRRIFFYRRPVYRRRVFFRRRRYFY